MNNWMDDRAEPKGDINKIRRGPGRRIAKEKRLRNMDPALLNKYLSLPPALQEKVGAAIEICYQQHMANMNKHNARNQHNRSHYDNDVEVDAEQDSF